MKEYKTKEWLDHKHNIEKLNVTQMAKEAGVHADTIRTWMRKNGVERRSFESINQEKSNNGNREYRNKEWLHEKYIIEELSVYQIAEMLNIRHSVINTWLKKHEIKTRSQREGIKTRYKKGFTFKPAKGEKHYLFGKKRPREIVERARKSLSGTNHYKWKGSAKHSNGYILIKKQDHPFSDKDGYVMEHRLIIEQKLGRYLTKEEQVHHINGMKTDNRVENLHLFASRKDHQHYHRQQQLGVELELKYKY